jgi:hypothetical protein
MKQNSNNPRLSIAYISIDPKVRHAMLQYLYIKSI